MGDGDLMGLWRSGYTATILIDNLFNYQYSCESQFIAFIIRMKRERKERLQYIHNTYHPWPPNTALWLYPKSPFHALSPPRGTGRSRRGPAL
jgi:hypothetical protein